MNEVNEKQKKGRFGRFLYRIFIHNIGYKFLAIIFGALIWALTVGL